jgi:hypothetical protein
MVIRTTFSGTLCEAPVAKVELEHSEAKVSVSKKNRAACVPPNTRVQNEIRWPIAILRSHPSNPPAVATDLITSGLLPNRRVRPRDCPDLAPMSTYPTRRLRVGTRSWPCGGWSASPPQSQSPRHSLAPFRGEAIGWVKLLPCLEMDCWNLKVSTLITSSESCGQRRRKGLTLKVPAV